MAKKDFNKDDMFNKLMGGGEAEEKEKKTTKKESKAKIIKENKVKPQKEEIEEPLIQKGYYITERLNKAILLKMAENPELDKSKIVRNALGVYLKDVLKEYNL